MASVLALTASSPFREAPGQHNFGRSCSSIGSANSLNTVQHHRLRSLSGSSLSSITSLWASPFRRNEDSNLPRSPSLRASSLRRMPTTSEGRTESGSYSRRTSLTSILSARLRSEPTLGYEQSETRLLDVAESEGGVSELSEDEHGFVDEATEDERLSSISEHYQSATASLIDDAPTCAEQGPSTEAEEMLGRRKWLSMLRRRKREAQPKITPRRQRFGPGYFGNRPTSSVKRESAHKKSDSQGSSLAFITAMKSATATLASVSIASASRGSLPWRRAQHRSSMVSSSDARPSVDSQRSIMDEAATQRSRKRRAKLQELLQTEENYVADVKALSNVYFTIIGNQPASASFARLRAQQNISEILRLHNDLMNHLYFAVPFADSDRRTAKVAQGDARPRTHSRWHSVDAVSIRATPTRSKLTSIRQARRSLNLSRSSEDELLLQRCSPQLVATVAKVFSNEISRFDIYEEYGANYELVQRDIDETQRGFTSWPDFDKGIEALSAHVNPVKNRKANRKKAMTIKDLLIKPIQRLPRYELLFNDLCRLTPVCDDPDSNASLQQLLAQINCLCQRVNEARNDPVRSRTLESTFLLGDRLSFSDQLPRSIYLQLLGQIHLCGCLYITWRSRDRIKGSYLICVLFGSTLLLANADEDALRYSIIAGVPLANATIVETDNGKGMQCYTTPHSWKVVFEYSARMYELILTACSGPEAQVWRERISARMEAQARSVGDGSSNVFEIRSPLISEMCSVGKAFGKPGSFVRRMSVHRTATVGPTTDLNQVVIKNTQSVKEALDNSSHTSLQIPRSQSVATPSHVQTLAPRRADRIRLENLLSDVWTKDLLAYPGMQARLSDPIRASANHVIRKFSMASITSNFSSSKRSASYASIAASRKEDMPPPKAKNSARNRAPTKSARPPLVDFHNAPEAFLPADFELEDPAAKRKKSSLRTFTLTMERPFSPLLGNDVKQTGLRRALSARDVNEGPTMALPDRKEDRSATPVYSVVQERPKTPAKLELPQPHEGTSTPQEAVGKIPRKSKSKSKLLRLFG